MTVFTNYHQTPCVLLPLMMMLNLMKGYLLCLKALTALLPINDYRKRGYYEFENFPKTERAV